MDGNRELEQLDAEARALQATLMRYMAEALMEEQGLNKLTAELTKIVQTSQRHTAESTARAEQKLQTLAGTVETLRSELRTLVNQSQEQLLREVRSLLSEQLGKRKKSADADALAQQLERLQLEVRNLARGRQARSADRDAPTQRLQRIGHRRIAIDWRRWHLTGSLAVLLAISAGYNVWLARRPSEPKAAVPTAAAPAKVAVQSEPAPPKVQAPSVTALAPQAETVVAATTQPDAKQAAWDKIWKAALDLPLQQCWPEVKPSTKVSKFRDCACPKSDKESPCEWSAKWPAQTAVATLQAVLSIAAAKPITIDAKVGAGTFNAIDLLVRDCGFKEPALTQSIEELRTSRGKAPSDGREPAAHQIVGFMKKNLHSCR